MLNTAVDPAHCMGLYRGLLLGTSYHLCSPVKVVAAGWPILALLRVGLICYAALPGCVALVAVEEQEMEPTPAITYRDDLRPTPAVIAALYKAAALNRPNDDLTRIKSMYDTANLVLTAWAGEQLVGILRAWSDGGFLAYIADLAVDPAQQRRGIGRELLRRATDTNPDLIYLLHAAPAAVNYYPRVGWEQAPSSWVWRPRKQAR